MSVLFMMMMMMMMMEAPKQIQEKIVFSSAWYTFMHEDQECEQQYFSTAM